MTTFTPLTPAISNRRLELADVLAQQGSSTAPAFGPLDALLRVGQGVAGGVMRRREEGRLQTEEQQRRQALIQALGGGGAPAPEAGPTVGGFAGGGFQLGGGGGNDDLAGVLAASGPTGAVRRPVSTAAPGAGAQQGNLPLPRQGNNLASVMAALPTPVLEQVAAQRAVSQLNPEQRPDRFQPVPGGVLNQTTGEFIPNEELAAAQERLRVAGRTQVSNTTNITPSKEQTEEDTVIGRGRAENFNRIVAAADAAASNNARLDEMRRLLEQGVSTGFGSETMLGIQRAASAFGLEIEGVAEAETFRALGNQMALALRNPEGGLGMPGAMSDPDREFLMRSVPGMQQSREGNLMMLEALRRMNNRNIEIADFMLDYRERNGTLAGARTAMREQFGGRNMFDDLRQTAQQLPSRNFSQMDESAIQSLLNSPEAEDLTQQELDALSARMDELEAARPRVTPTRAPRRSGVTVPLPQE